MGRLLVLALLVGGAATAYAQSDRDEARAHHDLARIKFARAEYAEALTEFERAYALAPELIYNIARCREELGDRRGAATAFRQYLAARPDAQERSELEAHLRELEAPPPTPTARPVEARAPVSVVERPANAAVAPAAAPIYRRWWFWTIAAALAVGAGVAIAAALTASPAPAMSTFPPVALQ